ncbi:MAG: hypothetical protein JXR47_05315 [Thiotrichales bacterium]|nr:hypothetical protein [Thiotrichales bacterium]
MESLEYIGAACAILGSLWLTHKLPGHSYGFVLFFIASVSPAVFFIGQKQYGAFVMELVFIYSNIVGIRQWIFKKEVV